jgi:hypothetical protein
MLTGSLLRGLWFTSMRFVPLAVLTAYAVTIAFELVTPIILAPREANRETACRP